MHQQHNKPNQAKPSQHWIVLIKNSQAVQKKGLNKEGKLPFIWRLQIFVVHAETGSVGVLSFPRVVHTFR